MGWIYTVFIHHMWKVGYCYILMGLYSLSFQDQKEIFFLFNVTWEGNETCTHWCLVHPGVSQGRYDIVSATTFKIMLTKCVRDHATLNATNSDIVTKSVFAFSFKYWRNLNIKLPGFSRCHHTIRLCIRTAFDRHLVFG